MVTPGTIQDLIDDWYSEKEDKQNLELGQLAWAHISYRNIFHYLRPAETTWDSTHTENNTFNIIDRTACDDLYNHQGFVCKIPKIAIDEELVANTTKKRPVIILCTKLVESPKKNEDKETVVLVVPAFSLLDDQGYLKRGIEQFAELRMQLLLIPNIIWLQDMKSKIGGIKLHRSYLDFRHIQMIKSSYIKPTNAILHEQVKDLLLCRLIKYITNNLYEINTDFSGVWKDVETNGRRRLYGEQPE